MSSLVKIILTVLLSTGYACCKEWYVCEHAPFGASRLHFDRGFLDLFVFTCPGGAAGKISGWALRILRVPNSALSERSTKLRFSCLRAP